jgi:hypothetical protein
LIIMWMYLAILYFDCFACEFIYHLDPTDNIRSEFVLKREDSKSIMLF